MTLKIDVSKFDSLTALAEAFPTEQSCRDWLALNKWKGKLACAHCGHHHVWPIENGERYKCQNCRKKFSVRHGTMFEESRVPLRKWFFALYLHTSHKKGLSSCQLGRDIRVTQKTAWFMLQRIRHVLEPDGIDVGLTLENPEECYRLPQVEDMPLSQEAVEALGRLDDLRIGKQGDEQRVYEVDETYIGGKEKNKHAHKRQKGTQGRSTKTKTPVLGMVERGGRLVAMPVDDVKRKTLVPVVRRIAVDGSKVMTDDLKSYEGLAAFYDHEIVQHGEGEFVKKAIGQNGIHAKIHTNTIENFWSQLKRGIIGVYHSISVKHLGKYIAEYCFRYNTRNHSEGGRVAEMMDVALGTGMYLRGRRLTYKQATGKEKAAASLTWPLPF